MSTLFLILSSEEMGYGGCGDLAEFLSTCPIQQTTNLLRETNCLLEGIICVGGEEYFFYYRCHGFMEFYQILDIA